VRFAAGQVPVQSLSALILDGRNVIDPATYDSVTVLLTSPEGASIDTSGGVVQVVDGKVRYRWPAVSLFPTPGDYSLVVRGAKGSAVDLTEPLTIEVYREVF
jgi:hypothetical protein